MKPKNTLLVLWLAACLSLAGCPTAHGQSDSDTINPLPATSPNNASYGRTREFLRDEDADRHAEMFNSFTVSGCTHSTAAGYTGTFTTTPCVAYPGGYRISDTTATVNYQTYGAASSDTCYLAVHRDASSNFGTFIRVTGTHYGIDCTSASRPANPTNGLVIQETIISAGAILSVEAYANSNATDGDRVVDDTQYNVISGKDTSRVVTNETGFLDVQVTPTADRNAVHIGGYFSVWPDAAGGVPMTGLGSGIAVLSPDANDAEIELGRAYWALTDATLDSEDVTFTIKSIAAGASATVFDITSLGLAHTYGGLHIDDDDPLELSDGVNCKYDTGTTKTICFVNHTTALEIRANSYTGDLIATFDAVTTNSEYFDAYYNGLLRFETLPQGIGIYGTTPITFADGSFSACDTLSTNSGNLTCNGGFESTATLNPASVANGAGTTTTFTCTGAILGDILTVGPGVDMQGLLFSASVTSTNNCAVRIENATGGTIDLASSTWKYVVRP